MASTNDTFQYEMSLIAACGKHPLRFEEVAALITADDFQEMCFSKMFEIATELASKDELTTPKLILHAKRNGAFQGVAEPEGLQKMILNTPVSGELVMDYANQVKELSMRRKAAAVAQEIFEYAQTDDFTPQGVIELAARAMPEYAADEQTFKDYLLEYYEDKLSGEIKNTPLTGFQDIDKWMQGIGDNRLIVLAARPGTGKTAIALQILRNIAKQKEFGVPVFFSLEMARKELTDRLVASIGGLNAKMVMRNEFNDEQRERFAKAVDALRSMTFHIDDRSRINVNYIKRKCLALKRKHGKLSCIFIDYLGLIDMQTGKNEAPHEAIARVTRELKIFASEIGCSIFLLAQLNRASEREKRPPIMSDLRGSGAIEQDADMIIFLYDHDENDKEKIETKVDFIVAKGRQTGIGTFGLTFVKPIQRMRERI
ncbi:replicative DNA helicase [Paenibacillus alvei]|uniref:replicative DNA helicase n=1 Tax=Paenibacillus alvei TaxID=44250 RepID=UPI0002894367|nr:DnaB-like helicase C-terminal domain-containing protein [Paenibacillus alvei]EJW14837.1 replicative DNA helicase [Paenibacillus alvei DSM 29]MCY9543703.1 replicative DNA helicase [Paenibacillus alvei]MCY9708541.1 replicative DNA helicase [Paenibacillus alvei]MEC0083242.1 DnaB-like helicase C-terminal domain-containing protein [Paenibacillus alvei]